MLTKTFSLLFVLLLTLSGFAQNFKDRPGYRFSNEDLHDILVEKSRSQKTKAIVALATGPVLLGAGLYIAQKNGPTLSSSGGSISVRESNVGALGASIGVLGLATTISSIPLFISSSKAKKEAALLLKNESTGFINRKVSLTSLSLQIAL